MDYTGPRVCFETGKSCERNCKADEFCILYREKSDKQHSERLTTLQTAAASDPTDATYETVNHPPHYTAHPSGVECIQITEHMNFCLGNAIKYIWRAGQKNNTVEDLRKARWYLDREIQRLEKT